MAKMTKFLGVIALGAALMAGPVLAEELSPETVVARVNGKAITLGHMLVMRATLPAQYQSLPDDVLFKGILDQLVQQAALAESVEPTLAKRDLLQLENDRRGTLSGIALQAVVDKAVTDEALQALYDSRFKDAIPGTEYHAAHILVDSEEKAKEIKAQIEGGVEFADAAKTHSSDGAAANGGDLGWFGPGMMVKPFEDAVLAMKSGELAGPVQTDFGWHLIKLIETRDATVPSLDDLRDELAAEIEKQAIADHLAALTKDAKIEKPGEGIDPAVLKDQTLLDK